MSDRAKFIGRDTCRRGRLYRRADALQFGDRLVSDECPDLEIIDVCSSGLRVTVTGWADSGMVHTFAVDASTLVRLA